MRRFIKLLMLSAIALAIKGCGGGFAPSPLDPYFVVQPLATSQETTSPVIERPPPQPVRGGHLHIAMPLPATLNPLLNSDPHLAQVLGLIFEPIVIFDEELRPVANPAIIENISLAPSGQSVTISLRNNIFWEDGEAISSADIAFSIDILRNNAPQTAIFRPNVAAISSHNIVDAHTIHINLASPMWRIMYYLDFPIIPAHYYTGVSTSNLQHPRNMHPIGNGAFRFLSYTPANQLELIANSTAPAGRPYIDRITATVLRDMADNIHAFEQGVVDVFAGQTSLWGRLRARGKNLSGHVAASDFEFIGFNHARATFGELAMRQAIAYFVGKNALPIHENSWIAIAAPEPSPASFAELGFTRGAHGILERQLSPGLPSTPLAMTVIVNEENARTMRAASELQAILTAEGVAVSLYTLEPAAFTARLAAGDFDIMLGTINLGYRPNLEFLRGGNRAAGNYINFDSADFNRLLDNMNLATNANFFAAAAQLVQEYIAENLPIIGLGFLEESFFTSPHLHGNLSPAGRAIFINAQSWFILDNTD